MSPNSMQPPPIQETPAPKSRLPRAERRHQLLEVGCAVFAERGFDAASIEEIAERAGVSRPIVYSHFGDKRGVFEAVIEREVNRIRATIVEAIRGPAPPRERLRRGLRAYFAYAREHIPGHIVLTREAPVHVTDTRLGGLLSDLSGDITQVISAVIESIGGRKAPPAEPEIYANALIGVGVHVGRWWQSNDALSVDEITDYCVALIWDGFSGLIESISSAARNNGD